MTPEFERLKARIDDLNDQIRPLLPKLAAARHAFMVNRTSANEQALDLVQAEVSALHEKSSKLIGELPAASGLPPEAFEAREAVDGEHSRRDQTPRESLTADRVDTTADIDKLLPNALARIESLLPKGWLEEEPREASRIGALIGKDAFLSLTKGFRLQSENSSVHRFRQALHVATDYLEAKPLYDHFAGALLVPNLVQFAAQGPHLRDVGGERDERVRHLWRGPSTSVDSTLFELLTAAACVEMGRQVEFLSATEEKSPDLRCHDPYPLVIECKRQQVVSDYEASEEAQMVKVFFALRELAFKKGVNGTFRLTLSVEASSINIDDVVAALVSQRLVPRPDRALTYPWGITELIPQQSAVDLPFGTRIYSPNMLEHLFGWSTDLPQWDGICCSLETASEVITDKVRRPIALIWKNISPKALKKRTWAPTNLFGQASSQVPPGEFGIVYVSYTEGGRAEIADMRVQAFNQRISEFEHSAQIRIPIALLCRLYPRALNEGQPDLIESNLRYVSDVYGEPLLFKLFPTRIYTPSA